LKFIHEDVFEALPELFADGGVGADEFDGAGDESAERVKVLLS
jgi:hypothetical protein